MDTHGEIIIKVLVKPSSKESKITYDHENEHYVVHLKSPPEKNKANKELIKLMTKYFNKRTYIKKGMTSKVKILEFED